MENEELAVKETIGSVDLFVCVEVESDVVVNDDKLVVVWLEIFVDSEVDVETNDVENDDNEVKVKVLLLLEAKVVELGSPLKEKIFYSYLFIVGLMLTF